MAELVNQSRAGDRICIVGDGWQIALITYHATTVEAWQTAAGCPSR